VIWVLAGSFLPILWGAPMLLLNPKVRETMRDRLTGFIDGLDSAE
jgi:hypothetical protein